MLYHWEMNYVILKMTACYQLSSALTNFFVTLLTAQQWQWEVATSRLTRSNCQTQDHLNGYCRLGLHCRTWFCCGWEVELGFVSFLFCWTRIPLITLSLSSFSFLLIVPLSQRVRHALDTLLRCLRRKWILVKNLSLERLLSFKET